MSNDSQHHDDPLDGRIVIVGAGAWGTTLSRMLSLSGKSTVLVARSASRAAELAELRENQVYLPGVSIPTSVGISHDLPQSIASAQIIFLVIPSQLMRGVASQLRTLLKRECIVVSCAKGFEQGSLLRMTEVIADAADLTTDRICALSGPNLAREIASGLPASTVIASESSASTEVVQRALASPSFRVYTSTDVIGVEFGGALKNVVALAAGAVDGMGAGHNAKAALICRGLAEMTRLGVAAGANPFTFGGLSGLGDLIATCESPLSRNRTFGEQLGRGVSVGLAAGDSPHVVEGVVATQAAVRLSVRLDVEMPIAAAVHDVLEGRATVHDAVASLMLRAYRTELDDLDTGQSAAMSL